MGYFIRYAVAIIGFSLLAASIGVVVLAYMVGQ